MINYCSFKYSRDESKKIPAKTIIKDHEVINLLDNNFKNIYKEIISYISKENKIDEKYYEINKDLVINDLCVDSGEKGYGYILLLIYKTMIKWQNSFINLVINSKNNNLQFYKELFESKIMIQDCEEDQLLKLPNFEEQIKQKKKEENNDNINLMQLIDNYSYRKNNKIIYNFDEIEEKLASHILSKIKCFKEEFRTVIYQYETYIGKRSGIITNFIKKYKQRKLTENELSVIINYIENPKNVNFDIKGFLFSIQILIDIILDNSYDENKTLFSIVENLENLDNLDLLKHFISSISNNTNDNQKDNFFTIDCLIDLMDVIQLFCWEKIRKTLSEKFLRKIDDNIKEKLDKYFENKNNDKNNFKICKLDLCTAIRRYISRYLSGKSDEIYDPKNELKIFLINVELWQNIDDINLVEKEINKMFNDIKVELSQAVDLYDYLGGDICKLNEIKIKYRNIEIENDNEIIKQSNTYENEDNTNIIKITKKKKNEEEEEEEKEEENEEQEKGFNYD